MSKDEPAPGPSDNKDHPASSETPVLSRKRESSWPSVLFYIHLNILGLYGVAVLFTNTYLTTIVFSLFLSLIGILGVTTGAHRLWAHRSYTANPMLRTILMLCQTMAGQVGHYLIAYNESALYVDRIHVGWFSHPVKPYEICKCS